MQALSVTSSARRGLATLAVLLLAFVVPVSAASAHDSLIGSSTEEGQSLQTVPEAVELTFTNPPIALGSEIIVEDADGKNWATGDVQIVDNVATQPISAETPAGKYTVTWRVVSSDSHPIEGVFDFNASASGSGGTEATSSESAPTESSTANAQDPDTAEAAEAFPTGLVVVIVVMLAAVVVVIAVVTRRRLGQGINAP